MLRVEALSFQYPQNGRGLSPVSFSLGEGESLHVSGLSGSGKSTLARCLAGLIPHLYHGNLHGEVSLDGMRTDQTPLWRLSEFAGLVFQNPAAQILGASVEREIIFGLENLGLAPDEIERRLEESLEQFGLAEMRWRSPHTLSGGEQQKLALAAVLARRPRLLVLDEPLSMLDSTSAMQFVDRLEQSRHVRQSLVICEHRTEYLAGMEGLTTLPMEPRDGENQPLTTSIPVDFESSSLSRSGCDCRLAARGLSVQRGARWVVDRLDFDLSGGQVTAIVGRNGAGKTTLLRTLAGLQPYEGECWVQADGHERPPQLGLVFQNPDLQLFNASVRDEILYRLPNPDLELYRSLLNALDLKRYEHTPPLLLSEGEKRRLALAILLMRQPEHGILLDEPALGQDRAHKAMLIDILRSVAASGRIVAYATHDIELALHAHRVVLLGQNGVAFSGPPQEGIQAHSAWERLDLRLPDWIRIDGDGYARPETAVS